MSGGVPPVVLVVDDDRSARRLVRMGLELEGIIVLESESLGRARQLLNGRIRGVVLDRQLPDGDGLALLADIGAACPDAQIVINSAVEDGREPEWAARVDKGDLPAILRCLGLVREGAGEADLVVIDLRFEAHAVATEWEELCRLGPVVAPGAVPAHPQLIVDAVVAVTTVPQPPAWAAGAYAGIERVSELMAAETAPVDVAIGQLVCLREAFRRHLPVPQLAERRARVDVVIDRAILSAARDAAATMAHHSADPETGLANRSAFDADLDRELGRALRYGRPLTLAVTGPPAGSAPAVPSGIDLSEGTAGPATLRRLAGHLATAVRAQDAVYRMGHDTLGVLLPDTDGAGAAALFDRLGSGMGPGVRTGIVTAPVDGDDVVSLLHEAARRRGDSPVAVPPGPAQVRPSPR